MLLHGDLEAWKTGSVIASTCLESKPVTASEHR